MLAKSMWLTMSITFCLAWKGLRFWTYGLIILKWCVFTSLQENMYCQIKKAVTEGSLSITRDLFEHSWYIQPVHVVTTSEACLAAGRLLSLLGDYLFRLAEAIDPDCDAMTAGFSFQEVDERAQSQVANSFEGLPFLRSVAAHVELSMMLTLGLALVSMWQLYIFHQVRTRAWETLARVSKPNAGDNIWRCLYHMCDVAGLHILTPPLQHLWAGTQTSQIIGDRYHAYRARVPELVYQGWFTVSQLACLVSQADTMSTIAPVILSISTTLLVSTKQILDFVRYFPEYRQRLLEESRTHQHLARLAWNPFKLMVALVVHTLGMVAIVSRLIGVQLCESHTLLIQRLECLK